MGVNITSGYNGEAADLLISLMTVGNQAVERGSVYVHAGVQKSIALPRFNAAGDQIQANNADPQTAQASSSFTYDERSIAPLSFMFYDEVNPRDFEDVWREFQPVGQLADRVENPKILNAITTETLKSFGTQIGKCIWQGDTAGATAVSWFDGYEKILAADGAINPTPSGVITAANVISVLESCIGAIPDALYDDPNMIINMSTKAFRFYEQASRALDFKGANISEAQPDRFGGFAIRHYSGMSDDKIIVAKSTAGRDSNLWAGIDVSGDDENVKIARKSGMSELFGVLVRAKYGVNAPNPTECVLYLPA